MGVELTSFVAIFRTGQLVHLDWACNELDEAGIPYQRREETSGGIRTAMPAAPSVGPGTWWTILVPESSEAKAREVLARLPFEQTTTPDVWSFQPKPQGKYLWKTYAVVAVVVILLSIILQLAGLFR